MRQLEIPYPQSPGFKATGTSQEAARDARSIVKKLRAECLEALKQKPMTADEVACFIGKGILSVRPRISELYLLDQITDTGERRLNASGKSANVWRVK